MKLTTLGTGNKTTNSHIAQPQSLHDPTQTRTKGPNMARNGPYIVPVLYLPNP
jgi:hypothetical protein